MKQDNIYTKIKYSFFKWLAIISAISFACTHNKKERADSLKRIQDESIFWKKMNALPDEIKNAIIEEESKAIKARENNDLELYETHKKNVRKLFNENAV